MKTCVFISAKHSIPFSTRNRQTSLTDFQQFGSTDMKPYLSWYLTTPPSSAGLQKVLRVYIDTNETLTIHAHTHSQGQFRFTNKPDMHVFRWWEKVPRENPHIHRENMQTPHREAPAWIQTRNPVA